MFNIHSKIVISDSKLGIVNVTMAELLKLKKGKSYKFKKEIITDIGSYILSYHTQYNKMDWDQITSIEIVETINSPDFFNLKNNKDIIISYEDDMNNRIFTSKGFIDCYQLKPTDAVLINDGSWGKLVNINKYKDISTNTFSFNIETKYNKCCFIGDFLFRNLR